MTDAKVAVVAFGTAARIAKSAVAQARAEGLNVGLIRPITLFPFPEKIIASAAGQVERAQGSAAGRGAGRPELLRRGEEPPLAPEERRAARRDPVLEDPEEARGVRRVVDQHHRRRRRGDRAAVGGGDFLRARGGAAEE